MSPSVSLAPYPAGLEVSGDTVAVADSSGTGEAIVSWQIPRIRENGALIETSEIAGYEISYRSNTGQEARFAVRNAEQSSLKITKLTPGEYTFSVVAVDIYGTYSASSGAASKTVE